MFIDINLLTCQLCNILSPVSFYALCNVWTKFLDSIVIGHLINNSYCANRNSNTGQYWHMERWTQNLIEFGFLFGHTLRHVDINLKHMKCFQKKEICPNSETAKRRNWSMALNCGTNQKTRVFIRTYQEGFDFSMEPTKQPGY